MKLLWTLLLLHVATVADAGDLQPEIDSKVGSVEILDASAESFLSKEMQPAIRATGFGWTEGPLWITDGGYLLFSDIPNNVIHKYRPGIGTSVYLENAGATSLRPGDDEQGSNGLLLDAEGRLILLQQGDRRVAVMDAPLETPVARYLTLAGEFEGARLNSPNDAVYHSSGSLYITDPPYGLRDSFADERRELPFQGVFRLDPNGKLVLLDDSVSAPNGIALSVDEETLYVAVSDKENAVWLAYDVQSDGGIGNKRVFFDANRWANQEDQPGYPDGMAVHSSGVIFATGPGGVWLFSPSGELLARILTGRATANCTLSADESTLYMTAHDTLMTLHLAE